MKDQVNWDLYRPHAIMAYRASVHSVTRKTSILLMLAQNVTLPMELLMANQNLIVHSVILVEKLMFRTLGLGLAMYKVNCTCIGSKKLMNCLGI